MKTGNDETYDRLRRVAFSMGASLFGVADLDRIRADTDLLNPCYNVHSRGISVGVRLDGAALTGIVDGPTREYCTEYLRVNAVLDSIATALAEAIEQMGGNAVRIPASEVIDWERLRGHLSHKLIGRYAGHGWIGRNILLVHPDFGARVRYVTVLTDLPLEADSPVQEACGTCMRCVAVCPAGAAKEKPQRFDLRACFNKLAEFNERLDEPHFICGLCVRACRGNKAARTD